MNESILGFTIKVVAARTGVSVHTLRAWERRYGVPLPNRVPGNRYRVYDEQDVADVLWMKQQIEQGLAPAQAGLLFQRERRLLPSVAATQPVAATQNELAVALGALDEAAARLILDEAFAFYAPEQVIGQIIQPTMQQIGEGWQRGEVTIGQEHFASHIVRQKLLAVLQGQPAPPATAPLAIAACAPAEEHEIGLLSFALLVRRQGWRVAYLGQGTPLSDLANLARASEPKVIAVSVTTVIGLAGLMPWLAAANRPAVPIVFAGRLVNLAPSLREHLPGTFLGEDALTAARALASIERRARFWSPKPRVWRAAQTLWAQRLKIAGAVGAQLMAGLSPRASRQWGATEINEATLYLADALASALAFDAPEIMDLQRDWLAEALPPRRVRADLIERYLAIFARTLNRALGARAQLFKPLLARLQKSSNV